MPKYRFRDLNQVFTISEHPSNEAAIEHGRATCCDVWEQVVSNGTATLEWSLLYYTPNTGHGKIIQRAEVD